MSANKSILLLDSEVNERIYQQYYCTPVDTAYN